MNPLYKEFKIFLNWIASNLLEAIYLVAFIVFNWVVHLVFSNLQTSTNLENWLLKSIQILFAISTLVPIVIHVIKKIVLGYFETVRLVKDEMNADYQTPE